MTSSGVRTKGDVIVNELRVGDAFIESGYGMTQLYVVATRPVPEVREDGSEYWTFRAYPFKHGIKHKPMIDFGVTRGLSHYGPELYKAEIKP